MTANYLGADPRHRGRPYDPDVIRRAEYEAIRARAEHARRTRRAKDVAAVVAFILTLAWCAWVVAEPRVDSECVETCMADDDGCLEKIEGAWCPSEKQCTKICKKE